MKKTVAILAFPNVQLLDISGPLDVFAQANLEAGKDLYDLQVISSEPGPLRSSSGVRVMPDIVAGKETNRIDTLLVAGAPNATRMVLRTDTSSWLRSTAKKSRRYGSICTGAFVLASAGLLDGRRATTHWASVKELAETYPTVQVDADALIVRDGKLRTAAGVTAGLDLAISLVEEDHGHDLAKAVASQLVMFFKRPGGQLQFSRADETRPAERSALQMVQRWVAANPERDHSVSSLAEYAGLSPRHFARLFRAEVGLTPAAWVEVSRVTVARRLLENGHDTPKSVAAQCGFANADVLARVFKKHVRITPAEYRKRHAVQYE